VPNLLNLVDVARRAAARAATYIRGVPAPAAAEWTEKSRHDYATAIDRTAEAMIAETLMAAVPGSVVIGEELTPGQRGDNDAEVTWIVDPLDGTTNFLHGYPQYAVSIGCAVREPALSVAKGAPCAGVVHDVARNLVYHAATGHGAWMGEKRLAVSTVTEPKRALAGTGFPFKHLEHLDLYLRQLGVVIQATSGVRRAGSAALDLADVAAGRFDAFWELSLAPWDVAAGVVLVREAGGVVTTIEGSQDVLRNGSIVAANPALHGWLTALVRNP
jgi:myo-inositol-1(or 4)-monophosphatase